jgi:hypothetical protein
MGIFSIISKGIRAMIDEANTPESFKIGQKFENYVREYLFVDKYYKLLERTHDYKMNSKDYVNSSLTRISNFLTIGQNESFMSKQNLEQATIKAK